MNKEAIMKCNSEYIDADLVFGNSILDHESVIAENGEFLIDEYKDQISYRTKKGRGTEKLIQLNLLIPMQHQLSVSTLKHYLKYGTSNRMPLEKVNGTSIPGKGDKRIKGFNDKPRIMEYNHQYYIFDGHHTIAASILNGNTTIRAYIGKVKDRKLNKGD